VNESDGIILAQQFRDAQQGQTDKPPIFFVNIVTVQGTPDEVSIEARRMLIPHSVVGPTTTTTAGPTWEEVYKVPPVVTLVLTFSAAKVLQDSLVSLLPALEQRRQSRTSAVSAPSPAPQTLTAPQGEPASAPTPEEIPAARGDEGVGALHVGQYL
jgi:hypothetical protein